MIKIINESESSKMQITVDGGLNADGFTVTVSSSDGNEIFKQRYSYGYNASYSKKNADYAHSDRENAIKYKWSRIPPEEPYVPDIIRDLMSKYGISKEDITVVAGRNVFNNSPVHQHRVEEFISDYLNDILN